jgi:hypothetical protein
MFVKCMEQSDELFNVAFIAVMKLQATGGHTCNVPDLQQVGTPVMCLSYSRWAHL